MKCLFLLMPVFLLLVGHESNNDQLKPMLYDGWVSKLIKSQEISLENKA